MGQDSQELLEAVLSGSEPVFCPFTGIELIDASVKPVLSPSARAGLEAPRFCQLCGRRMKVQIRPDGWSGVCSRHGIIDSVYLEQR